MYEIWGKEGVVLSCCRSNERQRLLEVRTGGCHQYFSNKHPLLPVGYTVLLLAFLFSRLCEQPYDYQPKGITGGSFSIVCWTGRKLIGNVLGECRSTGDTSFER